MIVKVTDIASSGNLEKERVIIKATAAGDIGRILLLRVKAAKDDGAPLSGDIPDAFWFPDHKIDAGDLVVLYTKKGNRSSKPVEGGATTHFFYWGKASPIWDESGYRLALVSSNGWTAFENSNPEE
jgi:hypothetical protein